jgi:hypothetical protein
MWLTMWLTVWCTVAMMWITNWYGVQSHMLGALMQSRILLNVSFRESMQLSKQTEQCVKLTARVT